MLSRIAGILFPRRCMMCGRLLEPTGEGLCVQCLAEAPLINGQSFTDGEMCRLFWHQIPIERAAAMFRYSPHSPWRNLVTIGKFGGRHDMMLTMGRLMGRHFMRHGFFDGMDALVPMPTPRQRMTSRGYNQAELLARGVAEVTGLPLWDDVARRRGDNGPQMKRTREERLTAMKGQFELCVPPSAIEGRHLLLIDDVCTTGSSLTALGETLAAAASVRLSALTLMRTTL